MILTLVGWAGCNRGDQQAASTDAEPGPRTTVVDPQPQTGSSPASAGLASLTPDSPPQDVCRQFLDLLRAGNHAEAELMLTKQALMETRRAQLELEAPGGPAAQFEIGQVRFATSKQEVAQVDCIVIDPAAGTTNNYTITWVMRRQPTGWKIAGMLLPGPTDGAHDLLSFENALDVTQIRQALGYADPGQVVR